MIDVPLQRHVQHAVGAQSDQRIDVVGGGDSDRFDAAQLADVLADLVGTSCPAAYERKLGVLQDGLHGAAPDEPGRPLHDSYRHGAKPYRSPWPGSIDVITALARSQTRIRTIDSVLLWNARTASQGRGDEMASAGSDLVRSIRELQARDAIARTISLYGQLLDDLRLEEFGELFTEEALWALPSISFRGRAEIVAGVSAMEPTEPGTAKHLTHSPIIEFEDDDHARAWTDLVALHRSDQQWQIASVGRYYDTLVRSGDRWLFSSRQADVEWPPGSGGFAGLIPCSVS